MEKLKISIKNNGFSFYFGQLNIRNDKTTFYGKFRAIRDLPDLPNKCIKWDTCKIVLS